MVYHTAERFGSFTTCNSARGLPIQPIALVKGATPINYHLKNEISSTLLCQLFNSLHCNTNQNLIEKHLYNQGSNYVKYVQFPLGMQRKPLHATTKSTLFAVSKDE